MTSFIFRCCTICSCDQPLPQRSPGRKASLQATRRSGMLTHVCSALLRRRSLCITSEVVRMAFISGCCATLVPGAPNS